jgi:hypothetical protein
MNQRGISLPHKRVVCRAPHQLPYSACIFIYHLPYAGTNILHEHHVHQYISPFKKNSQLGLHPLAPTSALNRSARPRAS